MRPSVLIAIAAVVLDNVVVLLEDVANAIERKGL